MHETRTPTLNRQPARRGSPDDNIRLESGVNFRGNFHRAVEVTSDLHAREKARRGQ
jgi:hypothetical protein